jgi:hypothetical protein
MDKTDFQKLWKNGDISNFHYLSILNSVSGRSYKDIM